MSETGAIWNGMLRMHLNASFVVTILAVLFYAFVGVYIQSRAIYAFMVISTAWTLTAFVACILLRAKGNNVRMDD
jgi:hypothetical protein